MFCNIVTFLQRQFHAYHAILMDSTVLQLVSSRLCGLWPKVMSHNQPKMTLLNGKSPCWHTKVKVQCFRHTSSKTCSNAVYA
jgi:hypothetical protein